MARPSYCYVVTTRRSSLDRHSEQPVAAFTVKHELKTWYWKQPNLSDFNVWRCPDDPSPGSQCVLMRQDEL